MKPQFSLLKKISSLGISSFISQIAIAIVMTVINYYLVLYGTISEYGADIPMAAFGIAMKFNTILVSLATGIGTSSQPIIGYNYGSGSYDRVRKSFSIATKTATFVAFIFFLVFQIFPKQLTAMFGEQGALYTEFSIMSLRIFPLLCFLNGFQIVTAIFFQSIGRPIISGIISLSRQILFLIPAIMILCKYLGINGVLWAGPVADGFAFILALIFILYAFKKIIPNDKKGSCVIVGRFADTIFENNFDVFKVFIYADVKNRIERCSFQNNISKENAQKQIKHFDKARSSNYNTFTHKEWGNRHNYDLMLNSSTLGYKKCANIICSIVK